MAGLFFLAGADFVGAMQLMIYVGGTLVLLVFGVMLTARGPVRLHEDRRRAVDRGRIWSAASLLAVLLQAVVSVKQWSGPGRRRASREAETETAHRPTPARHGPAWASARDQLGHRAADATSTPRTGTVRATCCRLKSSPSTCWSC